METTATMGFWSPRRFGQLLFRELVSGYRSLLIAMAAVGGSLIVISVLTALGISVSGSVRTAGNGAYYLNFFQNLLFIGGFIVSSLAFREIWHNGAGIFYLTIPGSIFEKFTSKLLVTSVGYALGSTVFFTAAAAVSEGLTLLIFGVGQGFFNPFTVVVLKSLLYYIVLQSVFLLGSIWYRKVAFMKTVLWLVIFGVAAGIVAVVLVRIGFASHLVWHVTGAGSVQVGGWSLDLTSGQLQATFGPGTPGYAGITAFWTAAKVLFFASAPVLWLASYFRLGEVEV